MLFQVMQNGSLLNKVMGDSIVTMQEANEALAGYSPSVKVKTYKALWNNYLIDCNSGRILAYEQFVD